MPIYEYQCDACGQQMEAIQKLSDSPLRECLSCGEPALRKKISAAGFRLKGGGWYETDFKSGKKRNLAGDAGETAGKAQGESAASGGGASTAKTDSASTAKTASA